MSDSDIDGDPANASDGDSDIVGDVQHQRRRRVRPHFVKSGMLRTFLVFASSP